MDVVITTGRYYIVRQGVNYLNPLNMAGTSICRDRAIKLYSRCPKFRNIAIMQCEITIIPVCVQGNGSCDCRNFRRWPKHIERCLTGDHFALYRC